MTTASSSKPIGCLPYGMTLTKIFKYYGVCLENEDFVTVRSYFREKNLNQMKLKEDFPPAVKKDKKVVETQPYKD